MTTPRMKKLLNTVEGLVPESLDGLAAAHPPRRKASRESIKSKLPPKKRSREHRWSTRGFHWPGPLPPRRIGMTALPMTCGSPESPRCALFSLSCSSSLAASLPRW